MIPAKLKKGAHVRVIAPARSLGIVSGECRRIACERLAEMGLSVSFGRHAEETDEFCSSSAAARLEDLHEAFADRTVDGILTVIGGFNSVEILAGIDYRLIAENPKILCGFSDITALANAIYAKTGLVTYSGPTIRSNILRNACFKTSRSSCIRPPSGRTIRGTGIRKTVSSSKTRAIGRLLPERRKDGWSAAIWGFWTS